MPDLAAAIRDFFYTATVLEAALAGIAMLSLLTAIVGWFLRVPLNRRVDRPAAPVRAARGSHRSAAAPGAHWVPDAGLVFSTPDDDFQQRPIEPRDLDDDDGDDDQPIFDEAADGSGGSARAFGAVRERPLEFLAGAVATGFAAGLIFPLFTNQHRTVQLLERLAKLNEENRLQTRREADRFRSARNG